MLINSEDPDPTAPNAQVEVFENELDALSSRKHAYIILTPLNSTFI